MWLPNGQKFLPSAFSFPSHFLMSLFSQQCSFLLIKGLNKKRVTKCNFPVLNSLTSPLTSSNLLNLRLGTNNGKLCQTSHPPQFLFLFYFALSWKIGGYFTHYFLGAAKIFNITPKNIPMNVTNRHLNEHNINVN